MVLDDSNFDKTIGNTELVILNFYADWCRFSQMLAPVWDDLAKKVAEEFAVERVVVGKVDCERQQPIASRFGINKYPTLKMLRHGQVVRKEYRGARTAEALAKHIKEQMEDPVKPITDGSVIKEAKDSKKRVVLAYLEASEPSHRENVAKLASALKDDCQFYAGEGEVVKAHKPPGSSVVTFSGAGDDEDDTFLGSVGDYASLLVWATDRCIPLVRSITFSNAEELTEEGLPFLILFHDSSDTENPKRFREVIERELKDEKANVNFLLADGQQFAHPLHHLGKSSADLPIIAVDSFRHMYLYKDYSTMDQPGKLKQFLADLHSGKLHREFHYGPEDPVVPQLAPASTDPPKSTFKKLGPSPGRYTLLNKEEL